MATRTDYANDPAAPSPTVIVPAVCLFVERDGCLLMIERADSGTYAVPGGQVEPGESVAAAAVRECLEETGVSATVYGLLGVFSDPGYVVAYSDGEVRQVFSVAVLGAYAGGELRSSGEGRALWVPLSDVEALPMADSMRLRVNAWLEGASGLVM